MDNGLLSVDPFPIKSAELAVEVNGQHTDIHCSVFTNHLYIVVTQFCKFGTLILVNPEIVSFDLNDKHQLVSTKVLFGKDEPLSHVLAQRIVSGLRLKTAVILALALRHTDRDTLHALMPSIQSCVDKARGVHHLENRFTQLSCGS